MVRGSTGSPWQLTMIAHHGVLAIPSLSVILSLTKDAKSGYLKRA
jgi:hypothetical protein